jgi:hypothetical protein
MHRTRGVTLSEMLITAVGCTMILLIIMFMASSVLSLFQSDAGSSPFAQSWAKSWGGSYSVNLDPGERLITAEWHGDEIWHLTRPLEEGEHPRVYFFKEKSRWGIIQGKVTINELAPRPVKAK